MLCEFQLSEGAADEHRRPEVRVFPGFRARAKSELSLEGRQARRIITVNVEPRFVPAQP